MTKRLFIVAMTIALGAGVVAWLSRAEVRAARTPLAELPLRIEEWQGRENPAFSTRSMAVLGVDDHVNRTYVAGAVPVALYVGYYESQRTGDTIHSPMKCLPGTGWQPLSTGRISVAVPGGGTGPAAIDVNRYVVQKGLDKYLVLFWYQSHGNVTASEYTAKLRLMSDAVRLNRTDGALVRLMVPIPDRESEARVDAAAARFVHALFPLLAQHLPS
jgi:EpsI family protein